MKKSNLPITSTLRNHQYILSGKVFIGGQNHDGFFSFHKQDMVANHKNVRLYGTKWHKQQALFSSNCPETALQLINGQTKEDALAWGYCGLGPDILSVYALMYLGWGRWDFDAMLFVKNHYQQFTKEVTSKLGDEFTLTKEQVHEWIERTERAELQRHSHQETADQIL